MKKKQKVRAAQVLVAKQSAHKQQKATRKAYQGDALASTKRKQGKRDKSTKHSRNRSKKS